ncbi:MAG TPA: DUF2809 domain-containing protein [Panacibacter sp.]|nr:DUF2809 domain-containing protein [Panacibacter sp.]
MLKRRIICLLLFCFCIWLALATRLHQDWFHPFIVTYGGDTIWAGAFLFLLRIFFTKVSLYKLALIAYSLGVIDELSQLWQTPLLVAIRKTTFGRLMLGVGFVWSDLLCYAVGILMAAAIIFIIEKYFPSQKVEA